MQEKFVKTFWANRLWINGLCVMLMASYVILVGDMSRPAPRIAMGTMLVIGTCMVVFSPLHAKTAESKFMSFAISALTAAAVLFKAFA